jgi:hypothetical protein
MPRFYFQLVGDLPVDDDEGEEFTTREAAVDAAHEVAHDLGRNRGSRHFPAQAVRLIDETGAEVATVPISDGRTH